MYSMYEMSVESNFRPVLYPIFGIPFTDTNNDRAGRGLDDTRDEGAKNNALER